MYEKLGGCPPNYLTLIIPLHYNNTAAVRLERELTDKITVGMVVKQDCVLPSLLLNVFLLAITIVALYPQDLNGFRLRYRFDGGAFHLERLKVHRKVSYVTVRHL